MSISGQKGLVQVWPTITHESPARTSDMEFFQVKSLDEYPFRLPVRNLELSKQRNHGMSAHWEVKEKRMDRTSSPVWPAIKDEPTKVTWMPSTISVPTRLEQITGTILAAAWPCITRCHWSRASKLGSYRLLPIALGYRSSSAPCTTKLRATSGYH